MLQRVHSSSPFLSLAMALTQLLVFSVCLSALVGRGAPFMDKRSMSDVEEKLKKLKDLPGFDPEEYKRYWEEMVKNDPRQMDRMKELNKLHGRGDDWQKMMENRPMFGDRMARSAEDIRSRLDEARRVNVEEMRQLQRLQAMKDDKLMKDGDWMTKREALRENLPSRFTNEDLQARLEKQQKILADLDKQRHEEFRRYEMQMEHRRREKLKEMNKEGRADAEKRVEEMKKQMREHERLKHPASKEQLEDVWENQDGFNKEEFDPKTFFFLHDKNGDKHLDNMELEALFYSELKKVYKDNIGGMEAHEDLARMREHAVDELDKNKDGMVSLNEFLGYTKTGEYDTKDDWKPVVDEDQFSEDDFKKFEDNYDDDYYDYEYDEDGNVIGFKTRSKDKKKEDDGVPPPSEQVKPDEPAKQDGQDQKQEEVGQAPERVLQIDDPKAVHIDAAEAEKAKENEPMLKQPSQEEGEKEEQGKGKEAPDPKANQL